MKKKKNYVSSKIIVGARYGAKDFIIQRVTGFILVIYTIFLLFNITILPSFNFENWRSLFLMKTFDFPTGKILSTLAFFSIAWHSWIGMRDIWMDYIKITGLRLILHVITILWLIASSVYFLNIIWDL